MSLSIGEQSVYDDALRRRSEKFEKPVWMDSIDATKIKLMLRKALAELPPEARVTNGAKVLYQAARRVVMLRPDGLWYQTHECDVDGLPICVMRSKFERVLIDEPLAVKEIEGGGVTCGHCANARTG
jgi:hypothetical protein